jgi:cyclopropane-fatty-acyl-phospholipid synthase
MSSGPAIPPAPRAPARAAIARRLFAAAAGRLGPLEVIGPRGEAIRRCEGAPRMTIDDPRFFDRIATQGNIGFAESYMAREWHADDLAGVLSAFAAHVTNLVPRPLRAFRRVFEPSQPPDEENTVLGAARNISRHYDLSNELFALFLDETMTYSCAVFSDEAEPLAEAQRRKYDLVAELAEVEPGMQVLEIGTGWGGMALHLAGRGCRVTTATLSRSQAALAQQRVHAAGADDAVDIQLLDYRQLRGRYDAIVSIEMFEAVGEDYWPVFFAECDRLLQPGGAVGLQTITMPHARYIASHRAYTWVKKYIFPGGAIPSRPAIDAALARASSLRVTADREIGMHYAETLRRWRERFMSRLDEVHALGFGDSFVRMWELYLAYCQAGFGTGAIGDAQLRLERP